MVLATGLGADPSAAERELRVAALSLTRGQTAQIHLSVPALRGVAPETLRGACEAELRFVDREGAEFVDRHGAPITLEVSVLPGQTRSLSLPASIVFSDGAPLRRARELFRGEAHLASPPDPTLGDPCVGAQLVAEIYDDVTGRTLVALPEPICAPAVPEPITLAKKPAAE
jgi:hypothetical protein